MNVWVDMAKGLQTGDARWSAVRERLLAGIAAGRLAVPIAAPTTWSYGTDGRRTHGDQ